MCWWFLGVILQSLIGRLPVFRILGSLYLIRRVMQWIQVQPYISLYPKHPVRSEGYIQTNTTSKTVEEKEKEDEENTSIPTLRSKCVKLEEEKQEMKTQRDDALRRLSEVMSSKLRDNNPNIVDLSDEFRPTKLAEMSSELYDNEWTEAFTVIEEKCDQIGGGIDEKGIIQILLDIFMVVYRVGKTTSEREWKTLVTSVMGSTESVSKEDVKYLKDLRKKYALGRLQEAQKTCLEKLRQSLRIEQSLFDEERVLVYIQGCVKLCWLAQCQDPPVVFLCPGFKSVGDNPIDGLAVSSNLGPERTTTPGSFVDNPNDILPVKDISNSSKERTIASGSLDDNENDGIPVQDTFDVSAKRISAPSPVEMNEWCSDESPTANQFGATGRDIDQMKAGQNDAKTRIEFDKGLNREFARNGPTEGECVSTKQGQRSESGDDDDRAEFDKTLYREYTKSGGYIEYVVWPVMLLHAAGPILAKGVAQGCD